MLLAKRAPPFLLLLSSLSLLSWTKSTETATRPETHVLVLARVIASAPKRVRLVVHEIAGNEASRMSLAFIVDVLENQIELLLLFTAFIIRDVRLALIDN